MSETRPITGGCLCGAIRYAVAAPPVVTRICWCRTCQFFGSGNGTVNVYFFTKDVMIDGAENLTDYASKSDSGNQMHRRFCNLCGTPLISESEARPHLMIMRAGTLDDPSIVKPVANIWTASAAPWSCIDPAIPSVPGPPPPTG